MWYSFIYILRYISEYENDLLISPNFPDYLTDSCITGIYKRNTLIIYLCTPQMLSIIQNDDLIDFDSFLK
jgi:hypothetical protein